MNRTRIIIVDGIEIHTSLSATEIADLEQKNKELKKQLEEMKNNWLDNVGNVELLETQQKEFIEYLKDEKDRLARECSNIYEDGLGKTRLVNEDIFNEVNDILQKYKEIIGDDV